MKYFITGAFVGALIISLIYSIKCEPVGNPGIKVETSFNAIHSEHDISLKSHFLDAIRYGVNFTILSPTKELSRENERMILELKNDIIFLGHKFESSHYENFTSVMNEYVHMKLSYSDMKCTDIVWRKEILK